MYAPLCSAQGIIDANARGALIGEETVLVLTRDEVISPGGTLDTPCEPRTGSPIALRYVARRDARLSVTTDHPATSFDTVLWVLSRCQVDSESLGCNDDIIRRGLVSAGNLRSRVVTRNHVVPAGEAVYLLVSSYSASGWHGSVGVSITELMRDGQAGGYCDGTSVVCVRGLQCVDEICRPTVPAGGVCHRTAPCRLGLECTLGRCVRPGSEGARCNDLGRCDEGLQCIGRFFAPGVCRRPLPVGAPCTGTSLCDDASACATWIPDDARCISAGVRGGLCRANLACDPGLRCALGLCVEPVAIGAACLLDDATQACDPPASCVPTQAGPHCVLDGAREGLCRPYNPERCEPPLVCRGDHCVDP